MNREHVNLTFPVQKAGRHLNKIIDELLAHTFCETSIHQRGTTGINMVSYLFTTRLTSLEPTLIS